MKSHANCDQWLLKVFHWWLIDFHKHKGRFFLYCESWHDFTMSFEVEKDSAFHQKLSQRASEPISQALPAGALEVAKDVEFVSWSELYLGTENSPLGTGNGRYSYAHFFNGLKSIQTVVVWDFSHQEWRYDWKPTMAFSDTFNKLQLAQISELVMLHFLKPGLPSPWLIPT